MEDILPRHPTAFASRSQASKNHRTAFIEYFNVLLKASQCQGTWDLTALEHQAMNSSLTCQAVLQLCGFDRPAAQHGFSQEEGVPDKVNVNRLTGHSNADVRVGPISADHTIPY